ncbi:MAG: ribose 5-phosphate isomerase A [Thermoprotei archaeon]
MEEVLKKKIAIAAHNLFKKLFRDSESIGIGTGSTIRYFVIEAIRSNLFKNKLLYASSYDTLYMLQNSGIDADIAPKADSIDIYIDGFDEASYNLDLVKGRGGAFHWEKILAKRSRIRIYIGDYTKFNENPCLFLKPIPIEVKCDKLLEAYEVFQREGLKPIIRKGLRKDGPIISDSGNCIIDLHPPIVCNPAAFDSALKRVSYVVETGIFPNNLVDYLLVAGPSEHSIRIFMRKIY